MPSDGKCMICGYRAPVTAFLEAAGNGDLVPEYIKLPQELQGPFYKYLALFKPASGRAMQNSKSIRLTKEMVVLVSKRYVSRKGKADRPCPPSLWVRGIEKMLNQVDGLELPMENHNYLRKVVYQLADQADYRNEQQRNQNEQNGNARSQRIPERQQSRQQEEQTEEPLSQIERQFLEKHGHLPGMEGAGAGCVNNLAAAWRKKGSTSED